MTLSPTFVDFTADPARTSNASIRAGRAMHAGDHWILDAGGSVSVDFTADTESTEVTLRIRALVSKLGPDSGYAPLDVAVNGRPLISGFRIPGGGDLPQTMTFAVPGEWLTDGTNTLQRLARRALTARVQDTSPTTPNAGHRPAGGCAGR